MTAQLWFLLLAVVIKSSHPKVGTPWINHKTSCRHDAFGNRAERNCGSFKLKTIKHNNRLVYSLFWCAIALTNIAEGNSGWISGTKSKKTLKHMKLHHQFLPGQGIDTHPQHNHTHSPKGSPHTFLAKRFSAHRRLQYKRKWIEAQFRSSLSEYKHTHTHTQVLLRKGNNWIWVQ